MKKLKKPEKRLLQIRLVTEAYAQLEELKQTTGLSTMTEVVKFSITAFKWIVEMQRKGYQIYAVPDEENPDMEKEKVQLLLPV